MAARAAGRRRVREEMVAREREATRVAARAAIDELIGRDGDGWLNGWPRMGDEGLTVLMGASIRCVGCGRHYGITCVVIEEGWEPPGPEPEWPWTQAECPVCREGFSP